MIRNHNINLNRPASGRRSVSFSRPISQQTTILRSSIEDKANDLDQISPCFKPVRIDRRIVKTAASYRSARSTGKALDYRRPVMTFDQSALNQESRAGKLGLQDYVKDLIISNKKQVQQKVTHDAMVRAFNKTWVDQKEKSFVTTAFQSKFGPRRNSQMLGDRPKVEWDLPKQEQKHWIQTHHINHFLFPCRKQSKSLKGRFYGNQQQRTKNATKIDNINYSNNDGSYLNISINDVGANGNKLLKRLISDQSAKKQTQNQIKLKSNARNSSNIRKTFNLRQSSPIKAMNFQMIKISKAALNV